ncbi:ABC transporter substrate binding protein [Roseibium sp. AS2]|uniref:ABC transporter substrate-binding protein n=1 Tax=Roseibium sp. AS2 TaxID=3135781 RepID=UPI00316DC51E
MKTRYTRNLLAASAIIACGSAQAGEVLFVDSYHEGYAWSDGIAAGIQETLDGSGHNLTIFRMDTKRNKGDDFKVEASQKAFDLIQESKPDVVIACDDNAAKFLIVEHLDGTDIPVVFCGLNWDASGYGFPTANVTGMVEVASADELVGMLAPGAAGDRVGFIGAETASEHKNYEAIASKFGDQINFTAADYVSNFEDFKTKFVELQDQVDILIFSNYAGIEGWEDGAAEEFILANTKIPTGSMQPFMQNFVTLVFGKVAEEQGAWSANAAMEIMGGKAVSDIPVTHNKEGLIIINGKIAEASGVELQAELVEIANSIVE